MEILWVSNTKRKRRRPSNRYPVKTCSCLRLTTKRMPYNTPGGSIGRRFRFLSNYSDRCRCCRCSLYDDVERYRGAVLHFRSSRPAVRPHEDRKHIQHAVRDDRSIGQQFGFGGRRCPPRDR